LELQDIIFCQSTGSYTTFYLTGKRKITSSYTLKLYDELLVDNHFFRVHKSFLINLIHLKMYRKGEGGTAVLTEDHEVEVSRRNKEDFIKIFKNRK
jgi:two-component system LytT family response regulator